MTVPTGAASISDMNAKFGGGNSLGNYYGRRWFAGNNARGFIQGSGPISISDFRGRQSTSPVSGGTRIYYGSQNIDPMPMFNNLTVTVVSGQGGQGGQNGNCAGGGAGQPGGGSFLSGYVGSGQGPGGAPGLNLGSQVSASTSLSINDSNQNDIIARYGTQPFAGVGGGGGGGATGFNWRSETICTNYAWVRTCVFTCVPFVGCAWYCADIYSCTQAFVANYCDVGIANGGGGAGGYVRLDWN